MPQIKSILKNKLNGARRVAVLGIGSELRADDAAGLIIAGNLKSHIRGKQKTKQMKIFLGQTAPENLTGQIKKFKPTHLIIIDAVDMQLSPGDLRIVNLCAEERVSFSTHRVPVGILRDYLYKSCGCQSILVGIQPGSTEFCGSLSPAMPGSIRRAAKQIIEVIGKFI
jgi:hydrogenase 3 maturation protease